MSNFNSPTTRSPWTVADELHDHDILDAIGAVVARPAHGRKDIADAIVEAMNERDKLKADCDRLRTAYADLWRAVKRIEADSRLSLGAGLEVASSALHLVHAYASSAIRAAEKKGFAPAIGEHDS